MKKNNVFRCPTNVEVAQKNLKDIVSARKEKERQLLLTCENYASMIYEAVKNAEVYKHTAELAGKETTKLVCELIAIEINECKALEENSRVRKEQDYYE